MQRQYSLLLLKPVTLAPNSCTILANKSYIGTFNSPPASTGNHLLLWLLLLFVRCAALVPIPRSFVHNGPRTENEIFGNNNNTRIAANANSKSPWIVACWLLAEYIYINICIPMNVRLWLNGYDGTMEWCICSVCVCVWHRVADCAVVKHSIRPEYVMNSTIYVAFFVLFFSIVCCCCCHPPPKPYKSHPHTTTHTNTHTHTLRTILILFINFPCRKYIIWATRRHSTSNWFCIAVYYVLCKWLMCCHSPHVIWSTRVVRYAHLSVR